MAKKIKTIIFDLGGVFLSRGFWMLQDYLNEKYGASKDEMRDVFIKKYYKEFFSGKMSEEEYWNKSLKDLNLDQKVDWKDLNQRMMNYFKPQEGMPELLNDLREQGYKTVLLSDQTKEWWPVLNKKYSIDSYFDYCIISAETGFHKPQPEIYELALEKSNSKAEESVFIDDLEHNLTPAKELGIKTILFENPEQAKTAIDNLLKQH